jgi:hypothetical protein
MGSTTSHLPHLRAIAIATVSVAACRLPVLAPTDVGTYVDPVHLQLLRQVERADAFTGIRGLQAEIEQAWTRGFDPGGRQQLNGKVTGTRKWIGATECTALLRSRGYVRVHTSVCRHTAVCCTLYPRDLGSRPFFRSRFAVLLRMKGNIDGVLGIERRSLISSHRLLGGPNRKGCAHSRTLSCTGLFGWLPCVPASQRPFLPFFSSF